MKINPEKYQKRRSWIKLSSVLSFAAAAILSLQMSSTTALADAASVVMTDVRNQLVHDGVMTSATHSVTAVTAAQWQAAVSEIIQGYSASTTDTNTFATVQLYAQQAVTTISGSAAVASLPNVVAGGMIGLGKANSGATSANYLALINAPASALSATQVLGLGATVVGQIPLLAANVAGGIASATALTDAQRATLATNIAGVASVVDFVGVAQKIAAQCTGAVNQGAVATNVAKKSPVNADVITAGVTIGKTGADAATIAAAVETGAKALTGVATPGAIALAVAGNFFIGTGSADYMSIGQVTAAVANANSTTGANSAGILQTLITGASAPSHAGIVTISGSLVGVASTVSAANVIAISGSAAAALASDSNSAISLASTIVTNLKGSPLLTTLEGVAEAITHANSFNFAASAPAVSATIAGTLSVANQATFAAAVAKDANSSTSTTLQGEVPYIAQQVGLLNPVTTGSTQGIIAKAVAAAVPTQATGIAQQMTSGGLGIDAAAYIAGQVEAGIKTSTTVLPANIVLAAANNYAGNWVAIGELATTVALQNSPTAANASSMMTTLLGAGSGPGIVNLSDSAVITVSSSVTGITGITAANIKNIATSAATALSGSSRTVDLASAITSSLKGANLTTLTTLEAVATNIANGSSGSYVANIPAIAKAVASYIPGATPTAVVTNQATFAGVVASTIATQTTNADPTQAGLIATQVAQLHDSVNDAANWVADQQAIAVAVAKKVTAQAANIAQKVTYGYASAANAGLVAAGIAGATGVPATSASAVAVATGSNFSGQYSNIALIGASVSGSVIAQAPAVQLALIQNLSSTSDQGIIAISSSITALSKMTVAYLGTIATQAASALLHPTDDTVLAGAIASSITTSSVATAANLEKIAINIASATLVSGSTLAADAPAITTTVLASGSNNGFAPFQGPTNVGTFATAVAKVLTGQAPQIAAKVAHLFTNAGDSTWEADQIYVAKTVATGVSAQAATIATTVQDQTLADLPTTYTSANFQQQARDYAQVAAQYSVAITTAAVAVTGSAAYKAGANATPTLMYQVAQIFGQSLAASNNATTGAATMIYGNPGVDGTGSVVGNLAIAKTSAGGIAGGIGNNLSVKIGASTDLTLQEQYVAVGLALVNWLSPSADSAPIANVVKTLASLNNAAAPDLVGYVLTDLALRSGATALTKTSAVVTAINTALGTVSGVNMTTINSIEGQIFSNGTTFKFSSANDPYMKNGHGVNTTYGTITGPETPVN